MTAWGTTANESFHVPRSSKDDSRGADCPPDFRKTHHQKGDNPPSG